jgi:hypothetical protein
MAELTKEFVEAALESRGVWDLANEVLYKLCADHPGHTDVSAIIAKTWLIGRTYAAAVERRRVKGKFAGDAFYEKCVAPKIRNSPIDSWLQELKTKSGKDGQIAVAIHKKLTDLLSEITGLNKRSFASKYLHFHFPNRFFLYDSRADKSARQLVKLDRKRTTVADVDPDYSDFCARCDQLIHDIRSLIGKAPTPRELDKVLLQWFDSKAAGA